MSEHHSASKERIRARIKENRERFKKNVKETRDAIQKRKNERKYPASDTYSDGYPMFSMSHSRVYDMMRYMLEHQMVPPRYAVDSVMRLREDGLIEEVKYYNDGYVEKRYVSPREAYLRYGYIYPRCSAHAYAA